MANRSSHFIRNNKEIILDTSAAMQGNGFSIFVKENEKEIENSGKKIQVLRVVWLELIKHYNSKDKRKVKAADQAISIISGHRNVFEIEDKEDFQHKIEHAFADKEILSKLTLDKTDSSILLITNDKDLSKDAIAINSQASCKGYEISTCYVTDSGNLCPGIYSQRTKRVQIRTESIAKENVNKNIEETKEELKEEENFKILSVLLPISAFAAGVAIGKYSDTLFQHIKSVA